MNMKDAFRFQNKLKNLMCEATSILQDRRNIVKVKTTHLRSKVMSDALDAVVEETAPSEYAGHANEVAAFIMLLMEERENLSKAIHAAKSGLDLDMDSEVGLNRQRPKRVVKDFFIKFTEKSQTSASFLPGRVYFSRRMGYNISRDKENLSSKE